MASACESTSLDELTALVSRGAVVVLSGAGLSTESGIPDYRGPTGTLRRQQPMQYNEFVRSADGRRRYWARSFVGWRTIAGATPNDGHRAVAALQSAGLVPGIITQNVDGLHQAAGAHSVIELHGNLREVVCLNCGTSVSRLEHGDRLRQANAGWIAHALAVNPDGDVDLLDRDVEGFRVVDCTLCGGILKPGVVFFGESVPAARVAACYELVGSARLLLVLGSSLTVMSGRRFVMRAAQLGVPVAIVNQGPTRGDGHATVTLDAPLGELLTQLLDRSVATGPR